MPDDIQIIIITFLVALFCLLMALAALYTHHPVRLGGFGL